MKPFPSQLFNSMHCRLAFFAFIPGLTAGVLMGLSASPVLGSVLTLLLTTSSIALGFVPEKNLPNRKLVLVSLCFFSLGILFGGLGGLYVRVNHLLYNVPKAKDIYQHIGFKDEELVGKMILAERNGITLSQDDQIDIEGKAAELGQSVFFSTDTQTDSLSYLKPSDVGFVKVAESWKEADAKKYGRGWAVAAQIATEWKQSDKVNNDAQAKQLLEFYWTAMEELKQTENSNEN